MFPPLSSDNWTTIIVATLALVSAYLSARIVAKKGSTDTLGRVQMENAALKVRVKELEDDLKDQRNKTALEMRHKIEAQAELEALRRVNRKKRRRGS